MLTKLKVKNYKSLADFKVDLHHFNVLIGPNNSGKSNILDCLAFVSDIVKMRLPEPFVKRGGYDHVVYGGKRDEEIRIIVTEVEGAIKREYTVAFRDVKLVEEELIVREGEEVMTLIKGSEGRGHYFDEHEGRLMEYSYGWDYTALSALRDFKRHHRILDFAKEIEKWKVYHFVPFEMREASPVVKKFDPSYKGEAAARALHSLLSEYLSSFTEIEDTLKSAIGEIENLLSPLTDDGKTYIAIKEKDFKYPFDYYQISDGTLRFLAHLMVVLAPKSELPSLVSFEEPENFVHPRLLQLLVEVLKKGKTQVIVTTHSPYLVDFVEPEDLIVIEKKEGKTIAKRLSKEEVQKFMKDFSLGELWYSGKIGGVP